MGAESPLRCRLVRSQESLQGLFLRPSCGPFPVGRFREFIAVTLVAVTQKVAVGTGQKAVFVLVPETPDAEVAGDGADIARDVSSKVLRKNCSAPWNFTELGAA
jgi:hypothetical protein